MKYIPDAWRRRWHDVFQERPVNVVASSLADRKASSDLRLKIVGAMHRAGVHFLAGADVPNPYIYPGYSLHEEFELLAEVGLSPLEILQTATVNPAKFLGREKEIGTIEKGKLADLVLLDANPLEDIRNTTKIAAVVANGRFLSKQDLEKLLSDLEKANSQKQSFLFDFLKPSSSEFSFRNVDICD